MCIRKLVLYRSKFNIKTTLSKLRENDSLPSTFNIWLLQFIHEYKTNGLIYTAHKFLYFNRELILFEKDLPSLKAIQKRQMPSNMNFIEIQNNTLENNNIAYSVRYRYLKALGNLRNGYVSFAILKDNKIIADVWLATPTYSIKRSIHPDLEWLGITLGEKDVYAVDIYVEPQERAKNLATFFWRYSLDELKRRGFNKVYLYVWADNVSSIRFNQKIGYKELKRIRMNRFLNYKKRES